MSARTDLERRLRRVEARQALEELVATYCMLLDARDLEGVAELFTPGGTLATPGTSVAGRDEVLAFYRDRMSRFELTYHYPHSHVLSTLEDERAAGVVCAHAEHGVDGQCVIAAIDYHDEYALDGGRWRFARRALSMRYYLPLADMLAAYRPGAMSGRPPLRRD